MEDEFPSKDSDTVMCVLRCPWNEAKKRNMLKRYNIVFPEPYASIKFDKVALQDNVSRVKAFLETVSWLSPYFLKMGAFPQSWVMFRW